MVECFVTNIDLLDVPLDHAERVRVGPEPSLRIKSIIKLPIDSNVFTLEVINVDWIKQHFEFNDFVPEFWSESNINHTLLILYNILIGNNPLVDQVTVLVRNLLVQLAEVARLSVRPFG